MTTRESLCEARPRTAKDALHEIQRRWIEVNVLPNLPREGRPVGAFVIVTDITGHRLATQALRESEERLAKFMQASAEGIAFHRDGIVTDANPPLCEMLGYTLEEVRGRPAIDFVASDHRAHVQSVLAGGHSESGDHSASAVPWIYSPDGAGIAKGLADLKIV